MILPYHNDQVAAAKSKPKFEPVARLLRLRLHRAMRRPNLPKSQLSRKFPS